MVKKSGFSTPKHLARPILHGQENTIVSEKTGRMWLPSTQMPANDNEPSFHWMVGAFLGRHLHWLAPTLLLALASLVILSIN